jgi:hypothetical protein
MPSSRREAQTRRRRLESRHIPGLARCRIGKGKGGGGQTGEDDFRARKTAVFGKRREKKFDACRAKSAKSAKRTIAGCPGGDRGAYLSKSSARAPRGHTCDVALPVESGNVLSSVSGGLGSARRRLRTEANVTDGGARTLEHTRVTLGVRKHASDGVRSGGKRPGHLQRRVRRIRRALRGAVSPGHLVLRLHLRGRKVAR